ncbi:MAG: MmgE/PrpD family protein [Betaproteobacteria bacterium]|nr:MmgE/PrpD family protein [Betaproteobacteria bacterium]
MAVSMAVNTTKGATAALAEWAAGFRLTDAPQDVIERMKALVLDYLRVTAVGAPLPWSRNTRALALELGGKAESSLLLCGSRVDAARAAFVNGAYAHACDLDDTHVGSMHHAGASILPAVFAVAERENCSGRALLEAAIIGYEASLRIGLATQPALFQRGFMATPTCGAMGAALAAGKLLGFNATDMAGALGAAGAYAGGLAQFYLSGGVTKRLNGARGAESGVMAALLTKAGIWGPRDILEGEAGFFKAFSGAPKPEKITGDLGRGYRLMEVSTKVHAGAGRLQATVDAGLALTAELKLMPAQVLECEVGIPKVVQGRLTQLDPPDLQSAQLSIPFSLAMALALGRTRGAHTSLRSTDYDAALQDAEVRALSNRTCCVLDAWVEAGTNTEEVPTRVTIKLASGATHEMKIAHPRGSPHRRMSWEEISALFRDTVGDAMSSATLTTVLDLVSRLDSDVSVREIMRTYVATPEWLAKMWGGRSP